MLQQQQQQQQQWPARASDVNPWFAEPLPRTCRDAARRGRMRRGRRCAAWWRLKLQPSGRRPTPRSAAVSPPASDPHDYRLRRRRDTLKCNCRATGSAVAAACWACSGSRACQLSAACQRPAGHGSRRGILWRALAGAGGAAHVHVVCACVAAARRPGARTRGAPGLGCFCCCGSCCIPAASHEPATLVGSGGGGGQHG